MTVSDPYFAAAKAPLANSRRVGSIAARTLRSPYLIIRRREADILVMTPYRPPFFANERQAAIDHAIAVMDEPLKIVGEFRAFSRDEMHERP